jgi:ADP-heptose:LPS heptosyltransferase
MKLLLILPGAIGDFILTLPSVAWLKRKLRPIWLELWTERLNLPLATSPGYADQASALADTGLDRWPTPETVFTRLKQFDRVISWRGAAFQEWNEEMRRRVPGMDFLPGFPPSLELHAMDFRRRQVESLCGPDESFPCFPQIELPQCVTEFDQEYLAAEIGRGLPIVMVHPGASHPRKRWGADHFSCLASQLMNASTQVLLCEGPLDGDVVDEVVSGLRVNNAESPLRRVRIENLIHLAAVIQRCRLYIGNDSGIGHLAAAIGTPTLSIFTVTDPRIWAPRGPRSKALVCPAVSEVLEETDRMRQENS